MTRINLVNPKALVDEHLRAEYKELPRVFTKVIARIEKGQVPSDASIPEHFKLNKGHETFFFNKCAWLAQRYIALYKEMQRRNFKPNKEMYDSIRRNAHDKIYKTEWWGYYSPRPADIYLSMSRLVVRFARKHEDVEYELRTGHKLDYIPPGKS